MITDDMVLEAYTDGGCRNYDGKTHPLDNGRIGIWMPQEDRHYAFKIEPSNSYQCEYQAIIAAMKLAYAMRRRRLRIYTDAQLAQRQIIYLVMGDTERGYDCSHPEAVPLLNEVERLSHLFSHFEVVHIPRKQNKVADRLCFLAMSKTPIASPSLWDPPTAIDMLYRHTRAKEENAA